MQPLGDSLKEKLGAPVEPVYTPGAGGDVAALQAAKARIAARCSSVTRTALGPVAFQNLIADEYNRWGKFIQEAGLRTSRSDGGLGLGTPR